MKTLSLICAISYLCCGCNSPNNSIVKTSENLYYDNYIFESQDRVSVERIYLDYHSKEINRTYNLQYILKQKDNTFDTLTCIINADKNYEPISFEMNNIRETCFLDSTNTYTINDKSFLIVRFIINPFEIDGAKYYFWTPDFGLIIKRSSTWGHFSKLQSENDSINQTLNILFDSVTSDLGFYLNASTIPKNDEENYINVKVEHLKRTTPKKTNGS